MFVSAPALHRSGFEEGTEASVPPGDNRGMASPEGTPSSRDPEVNGRPSGEPTSADAQVEAGAPLGGDVDREQLAALAEELEGTKEKLAETHDRMLRIAAEFDNARKRWERERDDVRKYSIADFARELLPVIDAFDKAMLAIENAEFKGDTEETRGLSAIIEGVQLVQKVFHESIRKHGIERLPGKGEPFNPEFHNAIARDVDQTIEKDVVAEEFVSGYRIGDRVLRTAMVKVLTRD